LAIGLSLRFFDTKTVDFPFIFIRLYGGFEEHWPPTIRGRPDNIYWPCNAVQRADDLVESFRNDRLPKTVRLRPKLREKDVSVDRRDSYAK